MAFTENVIGRTKHIERLLSDLGGTGKGLHEKASSVESLLHEPLLRKLRFIASVRNKLLHEYDYRFDGDPQQYLSTCDDAIAQLSALVAARGRGPKAVPARSPKSFLPTWRKRATVPKTQFQPAPGQTPGSNGCFPTIVCTALCSIVLPFSCTKTVKIGQGPLEGVEHVTSWEQVIVFGFLWAAATFFIFRHAKRKKTR